MFVVRGLLWSGYFMLKSILKMLDHTFPMFCVIIFAMSTIALPISISAKIITKEVYADIYYQQSKGVKSVN